MPLAARRRRFAAALVEPAIKESIRHRCGDVDACAGWVQVPASGAPRGTVLEIDAGTIVSSDGSCSWDADVFRRNTAGEWAEVAGVTGAYRGCAEDYRGGDVDGPLTLEAHDASFEQGSYGLVMYKAATRYEEFVALQL